MRTAAAGALLAALVAVALMLPDQPPDPPLRVFEYPGSEAYKPREIVFAPPGAVPNGDQLLTAFGRYHGHDIVGGFATGPRLVVPAEHFEVQIIR